MNIHDHEYQYEQTGTRSNYKYKLIRVEAWEAAKEVRQRQAYYTTPTTASAGMSTTLRLRLLVPTTASAGMSRGGKAGAIRLGSRVVQLLVLILIWYLCLALAVPYE